MGTLAVIICGLIGAGTAARKDFSQCWIFLVNLSFSLYTAILLNPLVVSLLEIPNLSTGYKNAIALGGVFLLMDFILKKVVEQIWSDVDMTKYLPELPCKIGSLLAGFFSGALIAAIVILCFVQTPFSKGLSFRKNLRSASGNTMLILVKTMNGFSFQWVDTSKLPELKALGIVPSDASSGKKVQKPAEEPKDKAKSSDDSAADTAKTADDGAADKTKTADDNPADKAAEKKQ